MAKFKLLLTADYEVFGDGSGCVEHCMIRPSNEMMDICEQFGTRMTFFVEVCEYWAFKEIEEQGKFSDGYRPATMIEEQLRDMVRRGHDVQLHFHPQWLDYEFVSDQSWDLNMAYWRLPDVPNGLGDKDDPKSIKGIFVKGVKTLEDLLKPINHEYRCKTFRAGAWCIQPEQDVLQTMADMSFKYDTTVAAGVAFDDGLTRFDFSSAPDDLPTWRIKDKVDMVSADGSILEVPICAANVDPVHKIRFEIEKRMQSVGNRPKGCSGQPALKNRQLSNRSNKMQKIKGLFRSEIQMLDFCGTSAMYMKHITKQYMKKFDGSKYNEIPVVGIGHPKNFGNATALINYLEWIRNHKEFDAEKLTDKSYWQV